MRSGCAASSGRHRHARGRFEREILRLDAEGTLMSTDEVCVRHARIVGALSRRSARRRRGRVTRQLVADHDGAAALLIMSEEKLPSSAHPSARFVNFSLRR